LRLWRVSKTTFCKVITKPNFVISSEPLPQFRSTPSPKLGDEMPIIYVDFITRTMVQENPNCYFVFGDNTTRKGFGGQAKEMRGEPNTIGVCTKRTPNMLPSSFFSGSKEDWEIMKSDILKIKMKLDEGFSVFVPSAGLGTERAMLREKAPKMYKYLYNFFKTNSRGCPWPKP
jgi:hypothetical protein